MDKYFKYRVEYDNYVILYKMSKYNYYYYNGLISYNDYRSVRDSYIGHLSYGNCYNLLKKISE
jgi:hypothetical protein